MNRIPKMYLISIVALVLLLALSMPVMAKDIEGILASVEPDDYLFIVVDEIGYAHVLTLRVDGQVFLNYEECTIWDLAPGDLVSVTHEIQPDEGIVATVIRGYRDY